MSRQQLELLVSDDSMQVPFGIVELQAAEGQLANLNLDQLPTLAGLHPEIVQDVEQTVKLMKLNEWGRLAFFYLSFIPHELPNDKDAIPDREAWLQVLSQAQKEVEPRWIADVMFFDGLPDPTDWRPRIISLAASHSIHDVMASDIRPRQTLPIFPYERLNGPQPPVSRQPAANPQPEKRKILIVISPDPERVWDQIQKIKTQLSFVPEFFDELRPTNQEMVAGVSYLQVDNSSGKPICRTRSLSPDRTEVIYQEIAHIKTSMPWDAMAYGDNLANSFLKAYDLQAVLPPPGDGRKWPADCPEHPCNWLLRSLDDPMPPYPGEPDLKLAPYPKGKEKLELDRWLFWTWKSGRVTWPEICKKSIKFGRLARPKKDPETPLKKAPGKADSQARTAKRRALAYAEWIGWK